jgi:hypothetical protein
MMMFVLANTVLLMSVRVRDLVRDVDLAKKGMEPLELTPSPSQTGR